MTEFAIVNSAKQAQVPHHIPAWAAHRGYEKQAQLVRALRCDKSLVSRWYAGATPSRKWQLKLAALFQCDRESLFRHPDEDWLAQFFRGREREEIERIKRTVEEAFPRKVG